MLLNLKNWRIFIGKPRPITESKFRLQDFDLSITEEQWRDSGNHLGWIRQQLASDYGKQFLGVLINSRPQGDGASKVPTDIEAAVELGRVKGYNEIINLIARLSTPVVPHEEVEADYGAKRILQEWNYPEPK